MPTALIQDERMLLHTEPTHPEQRQRLAGLPAALQASGLVDQLLHLTPRPATEAEIAAAHQRPMLEHTQMLAYEGGGWIDADTYVTPDSWVAATLGAGSVITAIDAVVGGQAANAFAVVRPPGHHATAARAMGFCLVNNVAVAARYATQKLGIERLAIIDWDVHHGNGTQDIFYEDPAVLYCSSHNYPFYPGTGHWLEMGKGAGTGTTLNVPLPVGTGDEQFLEAYDTLILPAIRRFRPELILVSAGYDSHWADPLGGMNVSTTTYAAVALRVYNLAAELCGGRLVCALEGGYNPPALTDCIIATLQTLLGQPDRIQDPLGAQLAPEVQLAGMIRGLQQQHPLLMP